MESLVVSLLCRDKYVFKNVEKIYGAFNSQSLGSYFCVFNKNP